MKSMPKICEKILTVFLRDYDRYYLLGDYEEAYNDLREESNRVFAFFWLWTQVFKAAFSYFSLYSLYVY